MKINVNSPEGNIFAIIGIARRFLLACCDTDGAASITEKVTSQHTYHDACKVVHEATGGAITFWGDDVQLEFEDGE